VPRPPDPSAASPVAADASVDGDVDVDAAGGTPTISGNIAGDDRELPGGDGQVDLDDGPEPSGDPEPSVAALRREILEKVAVYARRRWPTPIYVPGKTPAP
jgi:hypothetical protein